jgi:uncharacterized protein YdaU (DUF1376 family)
MSRSATWMPFYVGDYLADTGRLTTTCHGAYMLLIMDYWRNGPLPDDDQILATITRLGDCAWRKVKKVVRPFFHAHDGRLHHRRIDAELAKVTNISGKRRGAAQARHDANDAVLHANDHANEAVLHANDHANEAVLHTDLHADSRASALPSQSQKQKPRKRTPPNPPAEAGGNVGVVEDVYFQTFIDNYPRRKAIDAAHRAWQARIAEGIDPEEILEGLQRFEFTSRIDKIPYPANWLRAGQWRDVPDSAAEPGFDPVLRAVGLKPADFVNCTDEERRLLQ